MLIENGIGIGLGCKESESLISNDENTADKENIQVNSGCEMLCSEYTRIICSTPTQSPDLSYSTTNSSISKKTEDKEIQVDTLTDLSEMSFATMNIMELIRSDSNLNALTGIPKITYLDQITKISQLVINKLQYNIHFKLDLRERITMTFVESEA